MSDATTNATDSLVSRADNTLATSRNEAWQSGSYVKATGLLGAQLALKPLSVASTAVQIGSGFLELCVYPSKISNVANDQGVSQSTEQRVKSALTSFNESPFVSDQLKATVKTITDLNPPNGMSKDQFLAEVFSGAHVVMDGDKGALYKSLDTNPTAYNRGSSHYDNSGPVGLTLNLATNTHPMASPHMQRGIDLPNGLGHLLFGTRNNGGTIESWFQIEAHGTGVREFAPHMADFFVHKGSGFKQVAPFGLSTHTEKQVGQNASNELHVQ